MNDWVLIGKHLLLALIGGLVREIASEGQHSFIRFVADGFVAAFVGLMVYFACKHFAIGEYLTALFVGVGGYTGTPLLDIASKKLKHLAKDK